MSGKEEMRIFVGGLSWATTERRLEDAFSRFGKVVEAQRNCSRITTNLLRIALPVVSSVMAPPVQRS